MKKSTNQLQIHKLNRSAQILLVAPKSHEGGSPQFSDDSPPTSDPHLPHSETWTLAFGHLPPSRHSHTSPPRAQSCSRKSLSLNFRRARSCPIDGGYLPPPGPCWRDVSAPQPPPRPPNLNPQLPRWPRTAVLDRNGPFSPCFRDVHNYCTRRLSPACADPPSRETSSGGLLIVQNYGATSCSFRLRKEVNV